MDEDTGFPWAKMLVGAGAVVVVGYGGYKAYQYWQERRQLGAGGGAPAPGIEGEAGSEPTEVEPTEAETIETTGTSPTPPVVPAETTAPVPPMVLVTTLPELPTAMQAPRVKMPGEQGGAKSPPPNTAGAMPRMGLGLMPRYGRPVLADQACQRNFAALSADQQARLTSQAWTNVHGAVTLPPDYLQALLATPLVAWPPRMQIAICQMLTAGTGGTLSIQPGPAAQACSLGGGCGCGRTASGLPTPNLISNPSGSLDDDF